MVDGAQVGKVAMGLLFGANALLFVVFHLAKNGALLFKRSETTDTKREKKELSKPFVGGLDCFFSLTSELLRCGLILGLTYICEFHPFFEHSGKEYSRDLFAFVLILFFAYALYTVKPTHDLALLGREQTEEWKGWMQFIFLLYHYFHAEEVYNSVRVMITCYVWMTGFGNFSFFYVKRDYGWLRLAQMMWRLNFSVLLLMWTHGNTYILYYICPMHTFYFFLVYFTMATFSSVNYSKWGIRIKLMVVGLLIYLVWDINGGLFDLLFGWLGTDSVVGAGRGSVWEYYFRTSLDHYSSFFGMIFALNFPLAEQYFNKAKGWPLVVAAVLMAVVSVLWALYFYSKEKLEYNLTHSYTAIIPLTAYIFFRNITPAVRSGVSMSLHDLGKTTLETYLLQHHIWLTSNAKTLLTLVPDHPWINFAITTIMFFMVSKELYRITMSIRGMIMPDDEAIARKNILGTTAILIAAFLCAWILVALEANAFDIILGAVALALALLALIRHSTSLMENSIFTWYSNRFIYIFSALLLGGTVYSLSVMHTVVAPVIKESSVNLNYDLQSCLSAATQGYWVRQSCPVDIISPFTARCQTNKWEWNKSDCPLAKISAVKARSIFQNKRIMFMGDSIVRKAYHQFNQLIDGDYHPTLSREDRHSDLREIHEFANITVSFKWAPFLANLTRCISDNVDGVHNHDLVLLGVAPWDALYERNINIFRMNLNRLAPELATLKGYSVWLLPTPIIDDLLPSVEKQRFMSQAVISDYKSSIIASEVSRKVKVTIDPRSSAQSMEYGSADGLHYDDGVYDVIVQMALNSYALHNPTFLKPVKAIKATLGPKPTGSMSFPGYGAATLLLAAAMLFLMDSFLGIGFISLFLFGRNTDWGEAYYPLHKKLGVIGEKGVVEIAADESKSFLSASNDDEGKALSSRPSSEMVKAV